jgi:hypothetical protein
VTDTDYLTMTGVLERVRFIPEEPDETWDETVSADPDDDVVDADPRDEPTPPRGGVSLSLRALRVAAGALAADGLYHLARVARAVWFALSVLWARSFQRLRLGRWLTASRPVGRHTALGASTFQRVARRQACRAVRARAVRLRTQVAGVTDLAEAELVLFWANLMDRERPGHNAFISHHTGV